MRISSDLLYRLVDATGLGEATVDAESIEIPPTLLPVFFPLGVLKPPTLITTTEVQRQSTAFGIGFTQPASTAEVSNTVILLGRGLWFVLLYFMHHADFTSAPGANGGLIGINDGTDVRTILSLPNIANVSQHAELFLPLVLDTDLIRFTAIQGVTGAAQTMRTHLGGVALRMN